MTAASARDRLTAGTPPPSANHLREAESLEGEQLAVLRQMPTRFLRCRADGHNWKTTRGWGVTVLDAAGNEHHHVNWGWRAQECVKRPDGMRGCEGSVERYYSPTFDPIPSLTRMEYPTDGKTGVTYLTAGLGRIPPRLARRVIWEREAGPQPEAPDE